MKASSEDHDERDQIEWGKFEPAISFKALAWGVGLTLTIIAMVLFLIRLSQR